MRMRGGLVFQKYTFKSLLYLEKILIFTGILETKHTLSVENIRYTFLILSCNPFCPQNRLNYLGHIQGVSTRCRKRSTGMLAHVTPMLSTVVSSWLDILWVVDHSWYTEWTPQQRCRYDTNRCAWQLLPYPVQWHWNVLSCPFTLWMAHIHNPCVTLCCCMCRIATLLSWPGRSCKCELVLN